MNYTQVTDSQNFYMNHDPRELLREYGSPLYIYNESILRARCRELSGMCRYEKFKINYSPKANTNLAILQIVRSEGLDVDAMSPGEITAELMAGFSPSQIFYISNNVSEDEMRFAIDRNIKVSVDSLSQLEQYGRINRGGNIAIRFNPGIGAGHHEKVITGGKNTKFGVNFSDVDKALQILEKYDLTLTGINHHIGSLVMHCDEYIAAVKNTLSFALQFKSLEFIDFGGGFGIPYRKQDGESRLDLSLLGQKLDEQISAFTAEYGRKIIFKVEPGRYIPAECGVLLGTVHAVKYNGTTKYAGTDIGFNVLIRPSMYDAHHDIEIYPKSGLYTGKTEPITVVGNICETGDILAKNRLLPEIVPGDSIGILDAGAYGFSMCSNYNLRLRPAELLIREDSSLKLIRRRDTFDALFSPYELL